MVAVVMRREDIQATLSSLWSWSGNASLYFAMAGVPATPPPIPKEVGPEEGICCTKIAQFIEEENREALEGLSFSLGTIAELILAGMAVSNTRPTLAAEIIEVADEIFTEYRISEEDEDIEDELLAIYRELCHLLAAYYAEQADKDNEEKWLETWVRVTNSAMTHWPNLVGASVVQYTDWLGKHGGDKETRQHHYRCVVLDLEYLVGHVGSGKYARAEMFTALGWLAEAYRGLLSIEEDEETSAKLVQLEEILREHGEERLLRAPRYGVIAQLYCGKTSWIACLLRKHQEGADVRQLVDLFGLRTNQVEEYIAATEHYAPWKMLSETGVVCHYEPSVLQVLEAMERLEKSSNRL